MWAKGKSVIILSKNTMILKRWPWGQCHARRLRRRAFYHILQEQMTLQFNLQRLQISSIVMSKCKMHGHWAWLMTSIETRVFELADDLTVKFVSETITSNSWDDLPDNRTIAVWCDCVWILLFCNYTYSMEWRQVSELSFGKRHLTSFISRDDLMVQNGTWPFCVGAPRHSRIPRWSSYVVPRRTY